MSPLRLLCAAALALAGAALAAAGDATDAVLDRSWFAYPTFAGDTYTFARGATGSAVARHVVFGSGVPVISDTLESVTVTATTVAVGARVYVYDREADVLLDPGDPAARLCPARSPESWEHRVAPLLDRLGIGWREALRHEDARVRREGVFAVVDDWRHDTRRRFPEVARLLDDPDAEVRAFARWAADLIGQR